MPVYRVHVRKVVRAYSHVDVVAEDAAEAVRQVQAVCDGYSIGTKGALVSEVVRANTIEGDDNGLTPQWNVAQAATLMSQYGEASYVKFVDVRLPVYNRTKKEVAK